MTVEPEIQEPKKGRPSEFSQEVMTEICERMAEGKSLTQVCETNPDLPTRRTILRWVNNDDAAKKLYNAAQIERMHWYCDEMIRIAYDTSQDTIKGKDGQDLCNHEWIKRSEVKIRTLQWTMGRMAPKVYGERLPEAIAAREMESEPEAKSLSISWEREIVSPIYDHDGSMINAGDNKALRKRIAQLEEQLGIREGEPQPPKLLAFDPGPLPKRLNDEIRLRFARIIADNVPDADNRSPEAVIDEVLTELESAMKAKYGTAAAA